MIDTIKKFLKKSFFNLFNFVDCSKFSFLEYFFFRILKKMSKKLQSSNILDYFNFKRVATTDDSEKSQEHITLPQPVVAPSERHCDARQQQDVDACNGNMQKTSEIMIADKSSVCKNDNDNSVFDVGLYIQATARINDDLKYHKLTEPFKPHETYDFKKVVPEHEAGKRRFRHACLV